MNSELLDAAFTSDRGICKYVQTLRQLQHDAEYSRFFEQIVIEAKHEARSELSISRGDWTRQGAAAADLTGTNCIESLDQEYIVPRVHASQLTPEQFVTKYEKPKQPVIIEGLLEEWPARSAWLPAELLKRFPDTRFKVGSDDEGYPVRMKLKHYFMMVLHQQHSQDDSPLYIFDGNFADAKYASGLAKVRANGMHQPQGSQSATRITTHTRIVHLLH